MRQVYQVVTTPGLSNDLLAGSAAGAAQVIVGQPLDTVKTRAQTASSMFMFSFCYNPCID